MATSTRDAYRPLAATDRAPGVAFAIAWAPRAAIARPRVRHCRHRRHRPSMASRMARSRAARHAVVYQRRERRNVVVVMVISHASCAAVSTGSSSTWRHRTGNPRSCAATPHPDKRGRDRPPSSRAWPSPGRARCPMPAEWCTAAPIGTRTDPATRWRSHRYVVSASRGWSRRR